MKSKKSNKIKEIKKKITPILNEYGVVKASIFGSFAKDENDSSSDIDLLVEINKDISLLDFIELKLKLEDKLNKPIDLVEYNTVKPKLKQDILKKQVPIL